MRDIMECCQTAAWVEGDGPVIRPPKYQLGSLRIIQFMNVKPQRDKAWNAAICLQT